MKNKGFWALFGTAGILGTFGVWIRELDKYFGQYGQVIARSLAATLIIVLIIALRRIKFEAVRQNSKYLLGFSIVFPLSIIAFTYSATSIKVSNALFMLYVGSVISTYIWGQGSFS
jgi:drug/metabolite transporter (DMT)-like permease